MFSPSCVTVPEDLSLEERDELSNIRRRKRELLDDIEVCDWACDVSCIYSMLNIFHVFFYIYRPFHCETGKSKIFRQYII